jgi:preprotein translocase subunit SecG
MCGFMTGAFTFFFLILELVLKYITTPVIKQSVKTDAKLKKIFIEQEKTYVPPRRSFQKLFKKITQYEF